MQSPVPTLSAAQEFSRPTDEKKKQKNRGPAHEVSQFNRAVKLFGEQIKDRTHKAALHGLKFGNADSEPAVSIFVIVPTFVMLTLNVEL